MPYVRQLTNHQLIMANLLENLCEWNTFMCCWTKQEGTEVKDNTVRGLAPIRTPYAVYVYAILVGVLSLSD